LNAGYTEGEIYPINMEIGKAGEMGTKPWFGFNIKTQQFDKKKN
jgi:hypothetical protein